MANVEKEMKTRPAKWPLDTLDACVRDFLWRREPGGGMDVKADDIPAMCAEAPDFATAVRIAVASRRRNGKMHSHQTKVAKDARSEFGYLIIDAYPDIYRWDEWPLLSWRPLHAGFDEFYDFLWAVRPSGIGRLTTYDVAVRVGAYLGLKPDKIYLHTGARRGWEALWGRLARSWSWPWRVPLTLWPLPLRQLSADMAEDFLCTYRDTLLFIRRDESGRPI